MANSCSGTVIVVEDDPSMCQALRRILRLGEFVPLMYGSGEDLLRANIAEEAVCMVIDVQLPGMNGFALYDRLAEKANVGPVIFITAFDEPEMRALAARRHSAYVPKPFSGSALLEMIRGFTLSRNPSMPTLTVDGKRG